MPRPVQLRASYRNDGAYLLRLEAAVAKDDRHGEKWRQATCAKIRDLARSLLDVSEAHARGKGAASAK